MRWRDISIWSTCRFLSGFADGQIGTWVDEGEIFIGCAYRKILVNI